MWGGCVGTTGSADASLHHPLHPCEARARAPLFSGSLLSAPAFCGVLKLERRSAIEPHPPSTPPPPPQWLEFTLAYCGVLAFEGDPVEWVKNHRWHHLQVGGGGGGEEEGGRGRYVRHANCDRSGKLRPGVLHIAQTNQRQARRPPLIPPCCCCSLTVPPTGTPPVMASGTPTWAGSSTNN